MKRHLAGGLAAVLLGLWGAPAWAQAAPASGAPAATQAEPSAPAKKPRRARKKAAKAPTGQMSSAERRKQCSTEWKAAKDAGKVETGMKWPQFYSQCNTRLKGEKT